ncbi:MAG: hypothetical protein RI885_1256 [Actinomycetota bacterium]
MAWSTRELADLAGTTVNTVRHYHRAHLLDEPTRMSNGYKQYGARHLVRLLQIRRLRDLGVPLAQIEAVGVTDGSDATSALAAIDADLAASIDRLQRARAEIRAILEGTTATDVPAGFEDIAGKLSAADRSLMLVYSQLYDESAMSDLKEMVGSEPDAGTVAFDGLAADADETTRQSVAELFAPTIAAHMVDYPWLNAPAGHLSNSPEVTQRTFVEMVTEVYNEAQQDVLVRASVMAHQRVAESKGPTTPEEPAGD